MEKIIQIIENSLGISPELQAKLFHTIVVILVIWLVRWLIGRLIHRRITDARTRYIWNKTVTYITVVIAVFSIGSIWFRGFKDLSTYLGLLSAGLAIALKDPLTNIAGWLFIILRRSFTVGDRVQIGNQSGDVIDIRVFQFVLLEIGNWVDAEQSTGRIIYIPNSRVFTEPVANYSKGFQYIWDEIRVLITFESDWQKAKQILLEVVNKRAEQLSKAAERKLREASHKFLIFYRNLTPTVYTSVKDSGVQLTLRFLCEPRRRRGVEQAIWEDILAEFGRCKDIDFAYPTTRFYNDIEEGKQKTRAHKDPDTEEHQQPSPSRE